MSKLLNANGSNEDKVNITYLTSDLTKMTIISCTVVLDIMISYNNELDQFLGFLIVYNFQQNNFRQQCGTGVSTKYNSSFTDMVYLSLQLMLKNGVRWTLVVLNKT